MGKIDLKKYVAIISIIAVVMGTILFFRDPSITGNVPVDMEVQTINLRLDQSQAYLLTTKQTEPFILNSFRVTGRVVGQGMASIYIRNSKGQRVLVYTNVDEIKPDASLAKFTGLAVDSGQRGTGKSEYGIVLESIGAVDFYSESDGREQTFVAGEFQDACKDSCNIQLYLDFETGYEMVFNVEEGTRLEVDSVSYVADTIT
ncbi:hypothetical protein CL622_08630 [archaeon]|nr:hypothetical protein [archaeon]|tara:strand:+ start:1338 stop:1943 length:606 start_codon:yes stop_codon:yes gene_type:complete